MAALSNKITFDWAIKGILDSDVFSHENENDNEDDKGNKIDNPPFRPCLIGGNRVTIVSPALFISSEEVKALLK